MDFYGTARVNDRGFLEIGGCDTVELARRFGTPLYVMDEADIRSRCRQYRQALEANYPRARVLYASKAFLCTAMARLAHEEGLGLDVVSGGELYTALAAGFPPELIYMHGNNKSPDEVEYALRSGVGRFVADGLYDLQLIDSVAGRLGRRAEALLRVTPGVEAHTHEYIRTGQIDSKFGATLPNGLAYEAVRAARGLRHLRLVGLHAHIGSQIFQLEPQADAARLLLEFARKCRDELGFELQELNCGGGLGIRYVPSDDPPAIGEAMARLARTVKATAEQLGLPLPLLLVEPGRSIVGEAGTTLYTVGAVKEIPGVRTYVAVDGGMTDNPRPALYGARYQAVLANKASAPANQTVTIAGKCCESGDVLLRDAALARAEPGDVLAVLSTGAYNYAMASHYNRLPKPAVVFVRDGVADVVVRRETYADLIRHDVIPERMSGEPTLRSAD